MIFYLISVFRQPEVYSGALGQDSGEEAESGIEAGARYCGKCETSSSISKNLNSSVLSFVFPLSILLISSISLISPRTFVVRDNGIGMSEEFLKTIYDPFVRERNSTVSKIQGTGTLSTTCCRADTKNGFAKNASAPIFSIPSSISSLS